MPIILPADLKNQIAASIHEFVTQPVDRPIELQKFFVELQALPLILDWGCCFALKLTSEIIVFDWETLEPVEIHDGYWQTFALYQGSLRYPELKAVIPTRPDDARLCHRCGGTGIVPQNEDSICISCGGFGWFAPVTTPEIEDMLKRRP